MGRILFVLGVGVSLVACGGSDSAEPTIQETAVEETVEAPATDVPATDVPPTSAPPTEDPESLVATRDNPIPRGDEWSRTFGDGSAILAVTILDAKIGADATALLKSVNQFNDDPAAGNIHVLIRPQVSVVGPVLPELLKWEPVAWSIVANGRPFDTNTFTGMVMPQPEFKGEILPPGQLDGWVFFEVPETDDLSAVFLRALDRGGWWFALE